MDAPLWRYELPEDVVNYILHTLNARQVTGIKGSSDLLRVVSLINTPQNKQEVDEYKAKLEEEAEKAKAEEQKKEKK